ncbi:MAG: KpsF/GutQ family sugar-phosphate isomerase [Prevotellaceae bacterium]|jgi:arabinose-5-phosphate isomerase|nr:KpsF/GutQ family sugar-phosphate isomerase [Prevotellaceae bacterium]
MNDIQKWAIETISTEAKAIKKLTSFIDEDFEKTVEAIFKSKGKLIATGVGKSAIIAQKIVATLNSTGTPAVFMHAADAIHGDLGMITPDDLVLCLSKSGNTPEIKVLIPLIRNMGNRIISLASTPKSYLEEQADYKLKAYVDAEACPNNLAPTSSTTAHLVTGDALAICLLRLRGFSPDDFARVHPGGSLGKKLYLRVADIISKEKPIVRIESSIDAVILEISSKMLGATAVLDNENLNGIITDGDLRRMLEKNKDFQHLQAKDIMSKNPITIDYDELAIKAFNLMESHSITQLIVMHEGKYTGMVHIHDILREGII